MTPAEQAHWNAAHRRILSLAPEMMRAVLRAFAALRLSLTDAQITRLIASGAVDAIINQVLADAVLDVAFAPVRTRLRISTERAFQFATSSMPPKASQLAIQFDYLAPNITQALRTLETRVLTTLKSDVRETVRQYIAAGLEAKQSASTIATGLRDVIGLGPTQEAEVANFKAALLGQDGRTPFTYESRNRRYDAMLKKLYADGKTPTPKQVETMVDAYRKKRIAINAQAVAKTATTDAFKAGQRLSWSQAVEQGIVDGSRLVHQWIGVNDDRERPSHVVMNDEVQPWNLPYSNGQLWPGQSEFNCRCLDRFYLTKAA